MGVVYKNPRPVVVAMFKAEQQWGGFMEGGHAVRLNHPHSGMQNRAWEATA